MAKKKLVQVTAGPSRPGSYTGYVQFVEDGLASLVPDDRSFAILTSLRIFPEIGQRGARVNFEVGKHCGVIKATLLPKKREVKK